MQKLFFFLILLSGTAINQTSQDKVYAYGDAAENEFIKFYPHKFVSPFEVTNAEYQQFLNQLETEDLRLKYRPDSLQWETFSDGTISTPLKDRYHNHPAYKNHPVVNITKEAMLAYADWKTRQYNAQEDREFKEVIFRLPSEKEWMSFANPFPGSPYPWAEEKPYKVARNNKIEAFTNVKLKDYSGGHNYIFDGYMFPAPVGTFEAQTLALHDIIGNVAELCSDNVVKGGSWYDEIESCGIHLSQPYSPPHPAVGFRLVMEVTDPPHKLLSLKKE